MTELDVARKAARAAGAILSTYVDRRPRHVETKSRDIDLVTEVDRACERAVREVLAKETPEIPVLGEEEGGARGNGPRWVVDPVDGTTNFVHGFPFYAVSVALQVDQVSQVGVVLDVARQREYAAARGKGATRNGERIRVSDTPELAKALCGSGFPYDRQQRAAFYLKYWEAVLQRTHGMRRCGAATIDLSLVAEGSLDCFWEFHLAIWDVAASTLLVEEAGGRIGQIGGGALSMADPCPVATNARLFDVFNALLDGVHP
jgi:myo-inositol-1(or 4)-monophosphatase